MCSAISWFEIPALQFERACNFYDSILDVRVQRQTVSGVPMGVFPAGQRGVGGAICQGESYLPSSNGAVIYLSVEGCIETVVERVKTAGGEVLLPKTHVGDPGYIAVILDSEGNKIGLHSTTA